jgi:5'(3')-deoxyribonucleotidase
VRRIGVDVDGVLADFVQAVLQWANTHARRTGEQLFRRDQITEFDILKCWGIPHLWGELDRHISRAGVCAGLLAVDGAKAFLERLQKSADVVIVTSPWKTSPYWMWERRQWLEQKIGFTGEVIFTKRKDLIKVDALIDDCAEHTDTFPGVGVLIDQPWNQHATKSLRAANFDQAIDRLASIGMI